MVTAGLVPRARQPGRSHPATRPGAIWKLAHAPPLGRSGVSPTEQSHLVLGATASPNRTAVGVQAGVRASLRSRPITLCERTWQVAGFPALDAIRHARTCEHIKRGSAGPVWVETVSQGIGVRDARRPASSRWHLQARSRVIRPGATQTAGPEAVSAGPARQFCARDPSGSGANPETCRCTRTWPARGPRANTPADAQSMWGSRHLLCGYLTERSQPSADRPDLRTQPRARHAHLTAQSGGYGR